MQKQGNGLRKAGGGKQTLRGHQVRIYQAIRMGRAEDAHMLGV